MVRIRLPETEYQRGRREEREEIVEWIRQQILWTNDPNNVELLFAVANDVERGSHEEQSRALKEMAADQWTDQTDALMKRFNDAVDSVIQAFEDNEEDKK